MTRTSRPLAPLVAVALVVAACAAPASSVAPSATASTEPTPSATPSSTVTPSAQPASDSPSPTASAVGELRPFAVAANPEADALFLDRDDCENSADGYRLEFPDAWYTNTAIGDVEPCSWFSPTFYEVSDPSDVPPEIAITTEYAMGTVGTIGELLSSDRGIVGATQVATRFEATGATDASGEFEPDARMYVYVVELGDDAGAGPNLILSTSTLMGGDYELNKAVLDRIVATLELIGTIQ
jgi:hypothetical protein